MATLTAGNVKFHAKSRQEFVLLRIVSMLSGIRNQGSVIGCSLLVSC